MTTPDNFPVDPPAAVPPDSELFPRGMAALVLTVIVFAAALIIAVRPGPNHSHFLIGFLLGTCWGLTTPAAAWFALGPGRFFVRSVGSLVWIITVIGAFAVSVNLSGRGSRDPEVAVVVAICVAAQWLLLQIPLWILRGRFRFALSRGEAAVATKLQFGVRHLLIFTTVIGVALGIGRATLSAISLQGLGGEQPIFAMLTAAAILTTLPLVLAIFVRRYAIVAVLFALLFIAVMIPAQLQVVAALRHGGPDLGHLLWINAFQVGWIALIGGIVRAYGYRLQR